jgi:phosphate transport system permease protein
LKPAESALETARPSLYLSRGRLADRLFRSLTFIFACLILLIMGGIVWQLVVMSGPAVAEFGWRFIVSSDWDPVAGKFGALPLIFGTVVSSVLALLLAVPLGLGVAIFLSELSPAWLKSPIGFLVELLAGIPSVVYGLWGIFVLAPTVMDHIAPFLNRHAGWVPFFQGPSYGVGLFTAALILALMVVPFITSVSREVLAAVPREQREAALALGMTRWEVVRHAVLPYGRAGIIGAVILALGRALGETMAVTMVIGNSPQISKSLFDPAYSMAAVIANEFTEVTGRLFLSALIEVGLVLFAVTFVVNALARILIWKVSGTGRHRP